MANQPFLGSAVIATAAKPSRERTVGDIRNDEHRRWLDRNGYKRGDVIDYVLEGSSASSVTAIELAQGGGMVLEVGAVGMPVSVDMTIAEVSASWLADNEPGDWTLRLWKRTPDTDFVEVATIPITTTT